MIRIKSFTRSVLYLKKHTHKNEKLIALHNKVKLFSGLQYIKIRFIMRIPDIVFIFLHFHKISLMVFLDFFLFHFFYFCSTSIWDDLIPAIINVNNFKDKCYFLFQIFTNIRQYLSSNTQLEFRCRMFQLLWEQK